MAKSIAKAILDSFLNVTGYNKRLLLSFLLGLQHIYHYRLMIFLNDVSLVYIYFLFFVLLLAVRYTISHFS